MVKEKRKSALLREAGICEDVVSPGARPGAVTKVCVNTQVVGA